ILKKGLSGIPDAAVTEPLANSYPRPHSAVERVLEDLARLERQHAPRADRDLLPGLRVAARARVLVTNDEVPEAGDLDLLSALERLLDGVENRLDDLGSFLLRESADLLVHVLNNVGLRHGVFVYPKTPFGSTGYYRIAIAWAAPSAATTRTWAASTS